MSADPGERSARAQPPQDTGLPFPSTEELMDQSGWLAEEQGALLAELMNAMCISARLRNEVRAANAR